MKGVQIKCPVCKNPTQSIASRKTIRGKLHIIQIGSRHCRICNIIIPIDNRMGFWNGTDVIRPRPNMKIVTVTKYNRIIGKFVEDV